MADIPKMFLIIKIQQLSQNIAILAGIAEIQTPRMASDEHLPLAWIPASGASSYLLAALPPSLAVVHGGMTLLLKYICDQENV